MLVLCLHPAKLGTGSFSSSFHLVLVRFVDTVAEEKLLSRKPPKEQCEGKDPEDPNISIMSIALPENHLKVMGLAKKLGRLRLSNEPFRCCKRHGKRGGGGLDRICVSGAPRFSVQGSQDTACEGFWWDFNHLGPKSGVPHVQIQP